MFQSLARWILVAVLLLPAAARAQLPDLLDGSSQYMPGVTLDDVGSTETQITTYEVSLNVPVPLGPKTFLIPGASYHVDSLSYVDPPPEIDAIRAFHAIELSLLLVQLLPRDWSLSLRVAPGLAGDMRDLDSGMLRLNALAMGTKVFSERLTLGGGAMTSYSFGRLLPLPALYLDWRPVRALQVEAFLPGFAQLRVRLGDRVELGLRAELSGNAYAIRDCPLADRTQCTDHVAYSLALGGGTAAVRLFGSVWLNAYAGTSFFRRFELENADGEDVPGGVQDVPNAWFVRAGLTWRIPTD